MLFLNTLTDHMGLISLFVFLHAVYHKALHLFNKNLCNNIIYQREFIAALFYKDALPRMSRIHSAEASPKAT